MKRSEVKIKVTLGDVLNAPLLGAWEQMCEKYGIFEYCINEGMAEEDDTVEISLEDAEHCEIIEDNYT